MKTMMRTFATLLALLVFSGAASANRLERQLKARLSAIDAEVGVAVVSEGRVIAAVNDKKRYPLMSVFKLHQAMAVADSLQRLGATTDTLLFVARADLRPGTYSPLREKRPEGNFMMTAGALMDYSVQLSDNNACDLLFKYFGEPAATERYVKSLGIGHFAIRHTEAAMHGNAALCLENHTRPSAAARLMHLLFTDARFSGPAFSHLRTGLRQCQTGLDRLAAPLLGTGASIAHKTGTGGLTPSGRLLAVNDVAHVVLPSGRSYSIAVFVADARCSPEAAARLIADVSAIVFEALGGAA